MTLDRDLEVRTPEHVGISYRIAGIGNRVLAAFIDVTLFAIIQGGLSLLLSVAMSGARLPELARSVVNGVALVVLVLIIPFGYWIGLEAVWNGQTIGKRLVGIRVITDDGSPARFFAIFARGLLRLLDVLLLPIDLAVMVLSRKGQRLGDLVAGTIVVKAGFERDFAALRTRAEPANATVSVRALSGEEQRLVREFVLREKGLVSGSRASVAGAIAARIRAKVPESVEHPDDVELLHAVAASLHASAGDATPAQ